VFRELLQNSDDAGAKSVEIHFNTRSFLDNKSKSSAPTKDLAITPSPLPDLKSQLLDQWTFRNDGIPFRDEDWNRLKKIAEGNPVSHRNCFKFFALLNTVIFRMSRRLVPLV